MVVVENLVRCEKACIEFTVINNTILICKINVEKSSRKIPYDYNMLFPKGRYSIENYLRTRRILFINFLSKSLIVKNPYTYIFIYTYILA